MKPITTNNLSAWGYIGLMILFSMPYIGTPALILFAIFGQGAARNFARAYIILALISVVIIAAAVVLGGFDLNDFNIYFEEGGVEVFRYISSLIG